MLDDFDTHGRLALIPVSLYVLLWIPLNIRIGDAWWSAMNVFDAVLVLLAAVVFFGRDAWFHRSELLGRGRANGQGCKRDRHPALLEQGRFTRSGWGCRWRCCSPGPT